MHKALWIVLLFGLASAQENETSSSVVECDLPMPTFEQEVCERDDFFVDRGPKEIHIFNEALDAKWKNIYYDHQAHSDALITQGVEDFRVYRTCLQNLCSKIYTDCSSRVSGDLPTTQSLWCTERSDQLLQLQQAKFEYLITHNIDRKARSLQEEKIKALNYRSRTILFPILSETVGMLNIIKEKITHLVIKPIRKQ